MLKVLNQNTGRSRHLDGVYIGRGSRWGNPFIMEIDGNRNEVCDLFESYAKWRSVVQHYWLDYLKGKNLICHCAPKRCHGDILLKLANSSNETWLAEEGESRKWGR